MKPIQKAIIVGVITIVVYLSVVVITTPALEPLDAINAALIAASGSNAGVVITTTERYTIMVIIPTMVAFWIGFIYCSP